ncbi:twin-arginine translocase subunit TatC [Sphingobacterium spiritivorum]|uniref:Sec-independent protein translocase protein TatC n=3 Tax=Sphingobacterium spiritivorum TaxID=258 RepID=D7VMR4_SPHSI|nr:twin-arginine translocase subunit TatC [Sphingobacterium spiritivorum]EEI94024.1 twin arginine-targeting protein translocase TatC [Sphingobacterium spiritivorum ATCC 33300]EFK57211.1 twin arginine-targeting protein translocase TatC [Sphingobacterium spiritivorum ATCC 33861]QQS94314.1 twin-arginine translocase subunit TatC [Sphingobacterium spiritivorum]QQT36699.1 twin-arginine translocase subunit TatC [Sphingobacterium spiritivorum]WQD33451.1 twin-arginine translocase subunit TatC [Sphingob
MSKMTKSSLVQAIKDKGKNIEGEMSFFDHLEVLRWHIIRSVLAVAVFATLAFTFYDYVFNEIIMGPKKLDFWTYRMMCKVGELLHIDGFCVERIPFNIINTEMAGQFMLQINSCLITAVALGFPYLLFEVWLFVKPALTDIEKRSARGFVFYATILFALGVLFGYYIVVPLSVNFLSNVSLSEEITNQITIDSYLSTIATLSLGCGIVFLLPILIFILSKIGLMTPEFMRASRRYAVVIILVIAAVITPSADVITMLTVSAPMFILYEISIMVSANVKKARAAKEKEFYSNK